MCFFWKGLHLPLPLDHQRCRGCRCRLDVFGRHRSACPSDGRLKLRSVPMERTTARVCREAGARVRTNVLFRDMNIDVSSEDTRRVEVLVGGLPSDTRQLAVDATLRCALSRDGMPRGRAARENGAVLHAARREKEGIYHEVVDGQACSVVQLHLSQTSEVALRLRKTV